MVKAFIFDLGNTLIEYPAPEKIRENCEKFAKEMTISGELLDKMHKQLMEDRQAGFKNHQEATVKKALSKVLKDSGEQFDDELLMSIIEEIYYFGFAKYAYPVNGSLELMKFLKECNMKTGIISNTPFPGAFFKNDLERFGLVNYFQSFVWSSEFGKRKPSPDIFNHSLAELGIKAHEAVYVGDKIDRDVAGSRGAGMESIWFDRKDAEPNFQGNRITALTDIFLLKDLIT